MALDRKRLRNLMAVALSTEEPAEAAVALKKARKLLKDAKLDIHWLLSVVETAEPPLSTMPWWPPPHGEESWQTMLEFCHREENMPHARSNEREFLASVWSQSAKSGWQPTRRQSEWLRSIYIRLTSRVVKNATSGFWAPPNF